MTLMLMKYIHEQTQPLPPDCLANTTCKHMYGRSSLYTWSQSLSRQMQQPTRVPLYYLQYHTYVTYHIYNVATQDTGIYFQGTHGSSCLQKPVNIYLAQILQFLSVYKNLECSSCARLENPVSCHHLCLDHVENKEFLHGK